jgi:hypothetical protein
MPITLTATEQRARSLLIDVASGAERTRFSGLIGYKEFWEGISNERFGRGKRGTIVDIISTISAHEIENSRPPLNQLVVRVTGNKKGEPGEPWDDIAKYLTEFGVPEPRYASHQEAQQAAWDYWGRHAKPTAPRITDVEEGEPADRTYKFRKRNSKIIEQCKERDKKVCRACSFHLKTGDDYIIDYHHMYPLGGGEGAVVTSLAHLICLCPTCHRVAHTRRPLPLSVDEIRAARGLLKRKKAI